MTDRAFRFSFEFLRVFSPSAEVTGHTPDQAKLQVGKRDVDVKGVEPIGRYAVRFIFDDGHDSGIYSWEYLHDIGTRQQELWDGYLAQLKELGQAAIQPIPPMCRSCPSLRRHARPSSTDKKHGRRKSETIFRFRKAGGLWLPRRARKRKGRRTSK